MNGKSPRSKRGDFYVLKIVFWGFGFVGLIELFKSRILRLRSSGYALLDLFFRLPRGTVKYGFRKYGKT